MVDGKSEIDNPDFFFAPNGKEDADAELNATIEALLNENIFDDNASSCRFPARKAWLEEKLQIKEFPKVECKEYEATLERLAPKSVTLVFPAAHINSPASMFGHTFLRINSHYNSKLLAYAINYAANADPDKENATVFALKGLFGGYHGSYSLLPYYEKLKEYRDAEQRDIWEYDLNLSEREVLQMVRHIWELNGTYSDYYFFTKNCSYNMLWLIEIARPSVDLRSYFTFEVAPLESVHAADEEKLIVAKNFRPSKRTLLLEYEKRIESKNIELVKKLLNTEIKSQELLLSTEISQEQKRFIYEAAVEFLESSYSKNSMNKEEYLEHFHALTKARASLGKGEKLHIKTPSNPLDGHQAVRASVGYAQRDGDSLALIGIRPAYHDLEDSSVGFLRGTEIEFLDLLLSYKEDKKVAVENATLLSIVSLAQNSEFYNSLSWRANIGWDRDSLKEHTSFQTSVGVGYSAGGEFGYFYVMLDPLMYIYDGFVGGIGGSFGFVLDKYDAVQTNFEITKRYYDSGGEQVLAAFTQSFRLYENLQLQIKYDYKERDVLQKQEAEQTLGAFCNFYF